MYLAMLSCLVALQISGCKTSTHYWDLIADKILQRDKSFEARDGRYYPDFIYRFFKRAKVFEKDYPTISSAANGFKLIEVRAVNEQLQNQNESNLSWSSRGEFLSYESLDLTNRHIMLRSLSDGYQKKLAVVPKGGENFLNGLVESQVISYNSGLSWAKDDQRYAFMSNGGTGSYNIYVGSIRGEESLLTQSPYKEGYAVWHPNDDVLAFVSAKTGQGDIYLLDTTARKSQRLSFSQEPDLFPEWLADGGGLVYASGPSNEHQIMITKKLPKGGWSKPRPLTNWRADSLRPKVSPCGRWVAFYSRSNQNRDDASWNLHVLAIGAQTQTHAMRELSLVAKDVVVDISTGAAWSPTGNHLFFVKDEPREFNPIYVFDLIHEKQEKVNTGTKMNRDLLMSNLGVLSFRAQVGAWDRVYAALTNQTHALQKHTNNWLPEPKVYPLQSRRYGQHKVINSERNL